MSPVSSTYWGIPGYAVFWVLFAIAFGLFAQRLYLLLRLIRLGKQENRFDKIGQRVRNMLLEVVPQWCGLKTVTRKDLAGVGHAFMFWGFGLFAVGYLIFIGLGGFGLSIPSVGSAFERVCLSILDITALIVIAAIIGAVFKRYITKPKRLERKESTEEKIIQAVLLTTMISLMVLYYLMEGFRYAAYDITVSWPPIGGALAGFLTSTGISPATLLVTYKAIWWLNYVILLTALVYTPNSKHLHPLFSPFNIIFKPLGPKVVLEPIPLEDVETFGVSKIQDFTWKQLLDHFACTWCGRCHANCPATISGKSLSPRELILNLKEHLLEVGPGLLPGRAEASLESQGMTMIGDVVTEEEIWACTTCGACQEVCPVNVEHIRKIIDLRRNLVLTQNKMPESAQLMLKNMQTRGSPWAGAQSLRLRGDWTNNMELKILGECENVNTLFWVGCTGALIERNVEATLSLSRVLKAAGVDFGVLGDAETCCGDPARRSGYEFQFQILVEDNIEVFKSYGIKEIITSCPHCFNVIKNEYPLYGGDFKVVHYTELLADLIKQGRLKLTNELNSLLTFHDPCYLSRYNEVYQEPRQILQGIPKAKLNEMERSKNTTFCCGGGGGHMWIEEQHGTTKINQVRIEEVIETGAETVVTSCPYCLQMLEEGIEQKGVKDSLKAKDLVELVEAAMTKS
ncbi:MAG: (Fe-S)-binding protein [Pseudomonadota bacterium]